MSGLVSYSSYLGDNADLNTFYCSGISLDLRASPKYSYFIFDSKQNLNIGSNFLETGGSLFKKLYPAVANLPIGVNTLTNADIEERRNIYLMKVTVNIGSTFVTSIDQNQARVPDINSDIPSTKTLLM